MEATDELLTIAELAIGLAGFSGVVVAFSINRGLRAVDRFYFIALLTSAFTAVLLAYVPFLLHWAGVTGTDVWKGSSAVMLTFWFLVGGGLGILANKVPNLIGTHHLGLQTTLVVAALPVINLPFMIANIVGYPLEPGVFLYLTGLILWLTVAVLMFTFLVFIGVEEQDTPP